MLKIKLLTLIVTSFCFLNSCNDLNSSKQGELSFFMASEKAFDKVINKKSMPLRVDFSKDKSLLNRDYPIELALYKDGKWFYDLPRYGEGTGTWEFKEGKIHLFAKTSLFDMNIDIVSLDEAGESLVIKFRDRFGPKILNVEKQID